MIQQHRFGRSQPDRPRARGWQGRLRLKTVSGRQSAQLTLRAEGENVVETFLAECEDAREWKIDAAWGESCRVGRRIAPGGDFDGFYYARLQKAA